MGVTYAEHRSLRLHKILERMTFSQEFRIRRNAESHRTSDAFGSAFESGSELLSGADRHRRLGDDQTIAWRVRGDGVGCRHQV